MALRQAGWILETMDERYGKTSSQDIQDTQWIEEASLYYSPGLLHESLRPSGRGQVTRAALSRAW